MSDEEVQRLYDFLKKTQEAKGYYFNQDLEITYDLLNGLLEKRKRYGYVSCPCRLASGDREWDQDITCPCVYREPDVKEYGACYCELYVSKEWNEGKVPHVYVPERRPIEKIRF
ncbi:MAG TPA: ferredoxin-thioredoxin reductase catalytic domain-containing protein [Thermodesulfobacteriota bacterium]|nr:ferredoxin:thioredoxin reductase [Deltaproteobacteria bacterium]HNR13505.1 ferredoxin-thioredoxin reductase catalytic domain-containing protein [Thermodesulfobacteriota bacterium]HNU70809.1 ferredoxin-thioredoxin reductase catalytic domain-containing protein [Thermodesulfobacteriota bacterium]HOC37744.1 ferredoxin-thioredoxin reductase catalytic domain-containing protein [Thermodesulfobacteriota bacterium]